MTGRSHLIRSVSAACIFIACLWVAAVTVLWAGQSRLVFMTGLSRQYTSALDPAIFSEHAIAGPDGLRINAVSIRKNGDPDGYWILYCPPAGASTQVQLIQNQLRALSSLRYNVFAFDYRGFGHNAGTPSEEGLYADALAAHRYLTRALHVPASRIIVAGRSLGSAVAVDLATEVDTAGLLLFSPIDSVPSAAARLYPWAPARWLSSYRFDNRAKAARVTSPVLMIHGSGDRYLPLEDGRSLLREFRGPTLLVRTAGGHHHSGFVTIADLYRGMKTFWPAGS
jgi:pimeloyl-ACP methyl ester carboxylesterase